MICSEFTDKATFMRLLKIKDDGAFSLVKRFRDNVPNYAILSHWWSADHEEVTLKDMMGGSGRNKAGYQKICLCGKQALQDGLNFFWVDTCCIDKT
jgi:hypothetical protein